MPRTIVSGTRRYILHDNGLISGPSWQPSTKWRLVGAVTRNNFGHVVRRYSADDVLGNPSAIPWRHQNGKQKTYLLDYDHGTVREWRNPPHRVY